MFSLRRKTGSGGIGVDRICGLRQRPEGEVGPEATGLTRTAPAICAGWVTSNGSVRGRPGIMALDNVVLRGRIRPQRVVLPAISHTGICRGPPDVFVKWQDRASSDPATDQVLFSRS
jgi:hypothetical protein